MQYQIPKYIYINKLQSYQRYTGVIPPSQIHIHQQATVLSEIYRCNIPPSQIHIHQQATFLSKIYRCNTTFPNTYTSTSYSPIRDIQVQYHLPKYIYINKLQSYQRHTGVIPPSQIHIHQQTTVLSERYRCNTTFPNTCTSTSYNFSKDIQV